MVRKGVDPDLLLKFVIRSYCYTLYLFLFRLRCPSCGWRIVLCVICNNLWCKNRKLNRLSSFMWLSVLHLGTERKVSFVLDRPPRLIKMDWYHPGGKLSDLSNLRPLWLAIVDVIVDFTYFHGKLFPTNLNINIPWRDMHICKDGLRPRIVSTTWSSNLVAIRLTHQKEVGCFSSEIQYRVSPPYKIRHC